MCLSLQTLIHNCQLYPIAKGVKPKLFQIIPCEPGGQKPEQSKKNCSFWTHALLHYPFQTGLSETGVVSAPSFAPSSVRKYRGYRNREKKGQRKISENFSISLDFLDVAFVEGAKIPLQIFGIHSWRSSGENITRFPPDCSKENSSGVCRVVLVKEMTIIWNTFFFFF